MHVSSKVRPSCSGQDIQVEPLLHIEVKRAVRADMTPHERRQAADIRWRHTRHPRGLSQHPLQHQCVDVNQAGLQQVKRVHRRLLIVEPVAGDPRLCRRK